MSKQIAIRLYPKHNAETIRCVLIVSDDSITRKPAKLRLQAKYIVQDSRPVNAESTLFSIPVTLQQGENEILIPRKSLTGYSYTGKKLRVELHCEIVIDDAILFDTTVSDRLEVLLDLKPRTASCANELVNPKDYFSLRENFSAIPPKNKLMFTVLAIIAGIVITVNSIVGFHDQMAPESQTYFYSHRDSDGDSQSPLLNSLMGSGALGSMIWLAMRRQLRSYMSFTFAKLPVFIDHSTTIPIAELLDGVSRVDLRDATLRIVACNMECGQYKRGSGTSERTVSFKEPVHGVSLYQHTAKHIPAGMPLKNYFPGEVHFQPMFASLYPEQKASSAHGVTVHWEVQLLLANLVDQELIGPTSGLSYDSFIRTGDTPKIEKELRKEFSTPDSGLSFTLSSRSTET
jgi:hypothetical protein